MSTSLARRNRIKELWFGLPESWRTQLSSAIMTFTCDFALSLASSFVMTEDISITRGVIGAMLLTALRAGVKAVMMMTAARTLPDPKDS